MRRPRLIRRWKLVLAVGLTFPAVAILALPGCLVAPPPVASISSDNRLRDFPTAPPGLAGPARVHWSERMIPSIQAQQHEDVPYVIGLVHAHLRSAQMELIRRVATGRISESTGPFTRSIDAAIRAIDIGRATPQMVERLPDETRVWLERYVAGVNDYRATIDEIPADARALGLDVREPWTVQDVLTVGRLLSVDLNWGRWLAIVPLRAEEGYEDFARRLRRFGDEGVPSFGPETPTPLDVLTRTSKSGSNALVVGGDRSASGAGLMASDPHLGLPQPNIWCVIAYRSPAAAAAGITIPGLPFVLVGRNETIAWAGTNMQSPSSVLYQLPPGWEPTGARTERVGVRWWYDHEVELRESAFGPVVTDASALQRFGAGEMAMRWRGHEPSDEASTFLRLASAASWDEFRDAFSTYAVGGQNFLYADREGNIGQVLAWEMVPAAVRGAGRGAVPADDPDFAWTEGTPSDELPAAYNPPEGFLVSANNTPLRTDPPIVQQGNANDRLVRMADMLREKTEVDTDDLRRIQRDVFSAASLACARAIVAGAPAGAGPPIGPLVEVIAGWDGHYTIESTGAAAYQRVLDALLDVAYEGRYGPRIVGLMRNAPYAHQMVREDIESGAIDRQTLAACLERAARRYDRSTTWGEVHRIRLAHPVGAVPVLGSRYVFANIPTAGSTSTVHKSAHSVSSGRHDTFFGANARIVCDLSDPDANHVVLLGGQDGFLGADGLLDHVPLWQSGEMAPLPLSPEAQREQAVATTNLRPRR